MEISKELKQNKAWASYLGGNIAQKSSNKEAVEQYMQQNLAIQNIIDNVGNSANQAELDDMQANLYQFKQQKNYY